MTEPATFATVGPIPAPNHCDVCGDPTEASALCSSCAWHRYYDQLDEFWANENDGPA